MKVTKVYRFGDNIAFETDQFPNMHPTFDLHDLSNTPQTIDKLKDKLRDIVADPQGPAHDPHAQKFAILKKDIEGTDIGEL